MPFLTLARLGVRGQVGPPNPRGHLPDLALTRVVTKIVGADIALNDHALESGHLSQTIPSLSRSQYQSYSGSIPAL